MIVFLTFLAGVVWYIMLKEMLTSYIWRKKVLTNNESGVENILGDKFEIKNLIIIMENWKFDNTAKAKF